MRWRFQPILDKAAFGLRGVRCSEVLGFGLNANRDGHPVLVDPAYAIVIHLSRGNIAMTTSVLSVRVSEEERVLLEAASDQARTSLSDFVRRKALEAAEMDMLERPVVIIPAKDWEAFEAWANRPPQKIAALEELARTDPAWRE
jgi:uncharacterized protein (DUF1778 family)